MGATRRGKRKSTDRERERRVLLSGPCAPHESFRDALAFEYERTGLSPELLLRDNDHGPERLTPPMIRSWLNGSVRSASEELLREALELWRQCPERKDRIVILTGERLSELEHEVRRTGVRAALLLKNARNIPEGLDAPMVTAWLRGKTRTARPEHFDYVLARWKALPDLAPRPSARPDRRKIARPRPKKSVALSDVTPEVRAQLDWHMRRTGLSPHVLLATAPDAPDGLTPYEVIGWITGKRRKAVKTHLAYVLRRWAKAPTVV